MRIERVIAHAFGPFRGEALDLAPGLNVIVGRNEAGKSSWHAATRLAITGVRRGRGRATAADAEVAAQHRPWDAPELWEVETRLALDDGRVIDLHQDLAGRVDCRAVDVALGRDVSDEIMDGTPDASRWLGLDRDSFAATVCVRQTQMMAVLDAAGQLQEQMQRAASTRGTDSTAAEAMERLAEFRREAVGADTVAAKGPLRRAKQRVQRAETLLAAARDDHAEYLQRSVDVERAAQSAHEARRELAATEAALADRRARAAATRATRAAELSARHPAPPPALVARDELADRVAAALDAWERQPAAANLTGRSAAGLTDELAALPPMPSGDLRPHESVVTAARNLDVAAGAVQAHRAEEPAHVAAPSIDEAWIRDLARRLQVVQPDRAIELEAEVARARADLDRRRAPIAAWLVVGGSSLIVASAVAGIAAWAPVAVGGMGAVGLALIVTGWLVGSRARTASRRLTLADARLAPYRDAIEATERERQAAILEAHAAGLPADAQALEQLAVQALGATNARERAAAWLARDGELALLLDAAGARLRDALRARGGPADGDPAETLRSYEAACETRAAQSAEASRADSLRRELTARQAAEKSAAAELLAITRAQEGLVAVARDVGIAAPPQVDPVACVAGLRAWQRTHAESLGANQHAMEEWQELLALLDSQTLEDLAAEASRRAADARRLAPEGELELPLDPKSSIDLEARLSELRAASADRQRTADDLGGELRALRERLPGVADAEEELSAATEELARVEALAQTVDGTLALLQTAQERVHRDLAPVLAQTVARWLPVVSGGAYLEASVDPADLAVRVKEASTGRWRDARLLSEGTREQIYLLLRVAMAEHLVTTGEVAPLLLDEVTAQSDGERRDQLLEMLLALSTERQVILFTHDEAVAAWADIRLQDGRNRLIRLDPVAMPVRSIGVLAAAV